MAQDDNATPNSPSSPPSAGTAPVATTPSVPALSDQYTIGEDAPAIADVQAPATSAAAQPPAGTPAPQSGAGTPPQGADGRFLPKHLVEMAKDFGLTDADIGESTADNLGQTLRMLQRRAFSERSAEATVHQALERNGFETPAAAPTPAAPAADDFGPGFEDVAPQIQDLFRKQAQKIRELEGRLGSVTGHLQNQAHLTAQQQADAFFAQHPDTYGAGDRTSIRPGSGELARRQAIWNLAKTIKASSFGEQLTQAHALMYPAPAAAVPPTAAGPLNGEGRGTTTAEQWAAAGAARPTQRSGAAEPSGYDKAVESVRRKIAEGGLEPEATVSLDEFLE